MKKLHLLWIVLQMLSILWDTEVHHQLIKIKHGVPNLQTTTLLVKFTTMIGGIT